MGFLSLVCCSKDNVVRPQGRHSAQSHTSGKNFVPFLMPAKGNFDYNTESVQSPKIGKTKKISPVDSAAGGPVTSKTPKRTAVKKGKRTKRNSVAPSPPSVGVPSPPSVGVPSPPSVGVAKKLPSTSQAQSTSSQSKDGGKTRRKLRPTKVAPLETGTAPVLPSGSKDTGKEAKAGPSNKRARSIVPSTSTNPTNTEQTTVTRSPRTPSETGMREKGRTMGRPLVATARVTPAKPEERCLPLPTSMPKRSPPNNEVRHTPRPPSEAKRSPPDKSKSCKDKMESSEARHTPRPPSEAKRSPSDKSKSCKDKMESSEARHTPRPPSEAKRSPPDKSKSCKDKMESSEARYTPRPPSEAKRSPPDNSRSCKDKMESSEEIHIPHPPSVPRTMPPSKEARHVLSPPSEGKRSSSVKSKTHKDKMETCEVRHTRRPPSEAKWSTSKKAKSDEDKIESSEELSRPPTPTPGSVPSSLADWDIEMTKKRRNRTGHMKGPKLSTILDQVPGLDQGPRLENFVTEGLGGSKTVLQPITESEESSSPNGSSDNDTFNAMISKLVVEQEYRPLPPKKNLATECTSQAVPIPRLRPTDIFPSTSERLGKNKKSFKNIHKLEPMSQLKNKSLSGLSKKKGSNTKRSPAGKLGPLCGPLPMSKVPSPPLPFMETFQAEKRLDEELYQQQMTENDIYGSYFPDLRYEDAPVNIGSRVHEKYQTQNVSDEEFYQQLSENDVYGYCFPGSKYMDAQVDFSSSVHEKLPTQERSDEQFDEQFDEQLTANEMYRCFYPGSRYEDAPVNLRRSVRESFCPTPVFEYEREDIWSLQSSRPKLSMMKMEEACKLPEIKNLKH
ncbi:proteoglycan 4-like [Lineus longissimus]|uniref:proteoglycan 4-like n=1 Tax=Lineus longissimus TaxID=88925 RepID=UPI00315DF3AE